MDKKVPEIINVFNVEFPYGITESYLENELQTIHSHFSEINIFPSVKKGSIRSLSYQHHLVQPDLKRKRSFFEIFKMLFTFIVLKEIFRGPFRINRIKSVIDYYHEAVTRATNILESGVLKTDNAVINYSFWADEWSLALALLKRKGKINSFVFRVHGYDLYEERHVYSKIPFRSFVIEQAQQIYPVSQAGFDYLTKKYAGAKLKSTVLKMGVYDHGLSPVPSPDQKIRIVSCSNLIPLKRVHLIASTLVKLDLELQWVHFGNGRELQKIISILSNSKKIEFIHKGHVKNAELIDFYKNNPVNLFVHLSESEGGVPVSIQEAVSFGIPVVATDAGGIYEIINQKTGFLLKLNPTIHEICAAIEKSNMEFASNSKFRKNVRNYWEDNFNAQTNFTKFANHLKNVS